MTDLTNLTLKFNGTRGRQGGDATGTYTVAKQMTNRRGLRLLRLTNGMHANEFVHGTTGEVLWTVLRDQRKANSGVVTSVNWITSATMEVVS